MGLFDVFLDVISATVKVALTPVAVVKDAVNVATGQEVDATKELIKSAGEDITRDSIDKLKQFYSYYSYHSQDVSLLNNE